MTMFDPAANGGVGAFAAETAGPQAFEPGGVTLTQLRNGKVLALGSCPCGSIGGPTVTQPGAELYDPVTTAVVGCMSRWRASPALRLRWKFS